MPMFVDNSPPGSCIFCKLVAKEIPAAIVFEDAQTLAFMDLGQVNPGHVLVASKRHAANLLELTADEAAAVMRTAHHVARAVMASFDPPGLTLLQANGKEGDQTVFHFHMHVVPRHAVHQLHQMVKCIMACVLKPTRLFGQVIPYAQLHGIGKKRLRFKSCAFVRRHRATLQMQATHRVRGQLAGIGLACADQVALGLHMQAHRL